MAGHRGRAARAAAFAAAVLGTGHALCSAYWAAGGTGLLDTIGGEIERWARERGPAVVGALWGIAVLKLVVALAAPVLAGVGRAVLPDWTRGRLPRSLGWTAAAVLVAYGGLLTAVGLLVEAGVIAAAANADEHALAWHAYFWDPWFLLWGAMFATSLWLTRSSDADRDARSPDR